MHFIIKSYLITRIKYLLSNTQSSELDIQFLGEVLSIYLHRRFWFSYY